MPYALRKDDNAPSGKRLEWEIGEFPTIKEILEAAKEEFPDTPLDQLEVSAGWLSLHYGGECVSLFKKHLVNPASAR